MVIFVFPDSLSGKMTLFPPEFSKHPVSRGKNTHFPPEITPDHKTGGKTPQNPPQIAFGQKTGGKMTLFPPENHFAEEKGTLSGSKTARRRMKTLSGKKCKKNFDNEQYEKESNNLLGTVGSRKKYNCETSFGQIQLS